MVRDDSSLRPTAIGADADLVLFRVPVNTAGKLSFRENDYFVYRAHPKLDLIPKSPHACLGDNEIAVMSCADGKQYIVVGLKFCCDGDMTTFGLQQYRSKPDGGQGSWLQLTVEEPLRDTVCPIPDTAQRLMLYHLTDKVIILGGPKGTVGWVDLWRGIILCDVLEKSPKLRDLPFPLPAKGNWKRFLNYCADYCHDVTVSQHRDCIKYVEMEIVPPRMMTIGAVKPRTFEEWLRLRECPSEWKRKRVPCNWKATVWSMLIPVTTWEDWHCDCTADMTNLHVDMTPEDYELLHKLSGGHKEAPEATTLSSLGSLHMAYPTMSMDGDVVYLLTEPTKLGKDDKTKLVTAVDVKRNTLCGLAKLDSKNIKCYLRCCLATEISKHIKTTGTYTVYRSFICCHDS